jgi:hypothetical protein
VRVRRRRAPERVGEVPQMDQLPPANDLRLSKLLQMDQLPSANDLRLSKLLQLD